MITNSTTASAIHQKPSSGAKQRAVNFEQIPTSAKPIHASALQGAKDAVWVAEVGYSCIKSNITPIMIALEALTHTDGMTGKDLIARIEVIQKLARVGVRTAADMENTMDCEREGMQDKLNALEGALS